MSIAECLTIACAGFLSAAIKNGVGVGSGIFLIPTLSLAFPAKAALGLGGALMFGSDILAMRYYWRQWSMIHLKRILLPAVPGLLLGVWLLPITPEQIFRIVIGLFGIAYSLINIFDTTALVRSLIGRLALNHRMSLNRQAMLLGMLGGMATVLAHAGGLVWSMYFMTTCQDRQIFMGTLVCIFFFTNLYKILAYMHIGILSVEHICMAALAIPALYAGAVCGSWANRKVSPALFRKAVFVVICLTSCALIAR